MSCKKQLITAILKWSKYYGLKDAFIERNDNQQHILVSDNCRVAKVFDPFLIDSYSFKDWGSVVNYCVDHPGTAWTGVEAPKYQLKYVLLNEDSLNKLSDTELTGILIEAQKY